MLKGEIVEQLALSRWLLDASVLALMSTIILGDVLGSWHFLA